MRAILATLMLALLLCGCGTVSEPESRPAPTRNPAQLTALALTPSPTANPLRTPQPTYPPTPLPPTQTRAIELTQIATLTAPTPTRSAGPATFSTTAATMGPVQLTAQAIRQHDLATQVTTRNAACEEVARVYRENGQPFDPAAVARNPAQTLAEVQAMLGLADPAVRRTLTGQIRNDLYTKHVYTCAGR